MLVNTKDIKTSGSLGGSRHIAMTIDMNSLPHLMSVMADLYSDPAAAVIREYTTNAIDSHIASGQSRPVELLTPTRLAPFFVVQDFGVGMSVDDIADIYSQFGNSTKRGNNDEAGMLGLGSKSALTYTAQFTLIAIKDGVKALVSVSRSADGSGGLEIVSETATSEANGVTIKIPVNSDMYDFNDKVDQFARYVTPGKILVNGKEPERNLEFIAPNIAITAGKNQYDTSTRDRIVMGNVSYPTFRSRLNTHQVTYFVNMGEIDFTPSREELMDTRITRQTVDRVAGEFEKAFTGYVEKKVQSAQSIKEAWELRAKYNNEFNRYFDIQYQGVDLPDRYLEVKVAGYDPHNLNKGSIRWNETSHDKIMDFPIVTGYKNTRFSRVQARKIDGFLASKGIDNLKISRVILMPEMPYPDLYVDNPVFKWDDIRKFGVVKSPRQAKVAKTWEGLGGNASLNHFSWFVPDDKMEIWYGSKTFTATHSSYRYVVNDKTQFFYVAPSEEKRFVNLYPKAKHIKDYVDDALVQYLKNLGAEDYEFFEYSEAGTYRNEHLLEWTEIDDPELAKIVRYSRRNDSDPVVKRYLTARAGHDALSYDQRKNFVFPTFTDGDKYSYVMEKYPLLTSANYYGSYGDARKMLALHLHKYINGIYAEEMENNNGTV